MRRYEEIADRLDRIPESNRRICQADACACKGCAGWVGSKRITQQELDLYKSGEMDRINKENSK